MLRSVSIGAGVSLFSGGIVTLLLVLPRIAPYEFLICNKVGEVRECVGSLNPLYQMVFILSMAGTVLFFFGLFGRAFILARLFIIGMGLLALSLIGLVFGYFGNESCSSQPWSSCLAYHPELFSLMAAVGVVLISLQAYIHTRTSTRNVGSVVATRGM